MVSMYVIFVCGIKIFTSCKVKAERTHAQKLKELIQIPFIHHPAFNDDLLTTKSISLHSVFPDLPNSLQF